MGVRQLAVVAAAVVAGLLTQVEDRVEVEPVVVVLFPQQQVLQTLAVEVVGVVIQGLTLMEPLVVPEQLLLEGSPAQ
jgi:hypothetical protein